MMPMLIAWLIDSLASYRTLKEEVNNDIQIIYSYHSGQIKRAGLKMEISLPYRTKNVITNLQTENLDLSRPSYTHDVQLRLLSVSSGIKSIAI